MNDLKRKIAMIGTGCFGIAWIYTVVLKHMQYGRVISVAGFLVMLFVVFQLKNSENRDRTFLGLFIANLILITTLTARIRAGL
ncbi:MAG: hypothetical protein ACTTH0_01485 [Eubacteriales bacterium]